MQFTKIVVFALSSDVFDSLYCKQDQTAPSSDHSQVTQNVQISSNGTAFPVPPH